MPAFNPMLIETRPISSNVVGAGQLLGSANRAAIDALRGYGSALSAEDAAKAKIKASELENLRRIEASAIENQRRKEAADLANKRLLERDERLADVQARNINLGIAGQMDLLRNQPSKPELSFKDIAKGVEEQGGLSKMIKDAAKTIEDENLILDVNYSPGSKETIHGGLISVLSGDKEMQKQFALDKPGFTKMFIETMGKTDYSYNPFGGEDEWIPDTSEQSIERLRKRIKSLKGK